MNRATSGALRPALLLALSVARHGQAQDPPVPAPAGLRPFLGFSRTPAAALERCRRVVDEDGEFRRRVAAEATVDQVGSVGFLWLTRPEGWEATMAGLQAGLERDRSLSSAERARHDLERREAAAREAARQSEQDRRALAARLDEARTAHAALERDARALHEALRDARADVERADHERRAAVQALKDRERQLAERTAEVRELRAAVDTLRQEADALRSAPTVAGGHPEAVGPDAASLRDAVGAARDAARALDEALATAAGLLGPTAPGAGDAPPAGPPGGASAGPGRAGSVAATGPSTATAAASPSARAGGHRRRPLRMPPGVFEDSAEAAAHLVRVPGVVLLVDGYNVSKTGWPDLPLPLQRERLLTALVALQARCGAAVHVVFDGVDDGSARDRAGPGRLRVEFTAAGVEADDRILERLDTIPADRPVVIATDDRRIRDGARRSGTNSIGARQLLTLLR